MTIPSDAVLLIPEPDPGEKPDFDLKPGYYNRNEMLELLSANASRKDVIHFIADMLETGNPEYDSFVEFLRSNASDSKYIRDALKSCFDSSGRSP